MSDNEPNSKENCKVMADKGYTLKNIKTWNTHDGGGYQVVLYKDKKKVAMFVDDGNGGQVYCPHHEIASKQLLDEFEADVKALPQWFCFDKMIDMSSDIVISDMLSDVEEKRRIARMIKTKVIATLPDGKQYSWKVTPVWTRERLTAKLIAEGAVDIIGGAP